MKNKVFVTDGFWRKTLAAVRALAKQGLDVGVGERTVLSQALFSRHVKWRRIYPSVTGRSAEFVKWLGQNVKGKYRVLITPEEDTALLVAKHRESIEKDIKIALPEYSKMIFVRDKLNLLSHAGKLQVPIPAGNNVSCFRDIPDSVHSLKYPLVLKPRIGSGARGIRYIHKVNDFNDLDQGVFNRHGAFLIQEYVPGDEYYGVSVIFNKQGRMRSAFVHKKIRQYPITGGVSTYAVSVKYPKLVELSEKLLESLSWYGVANIEYKIDKRDNTPKLMEINPRLWGSLDLAVKSGVNFPYLLYQLALSGDIEPVFDYKTDVKMRWLIQGDLMSFASGLIKKNKIDWDFFKFYEKNMHYAILSFSDPLPVFGKMLSIIDYLTSEEMKRFRG